MGAWGYVAPRIETATRVLNGKEQRPEYVGRRAEAAPAAGSAKIHDAEMAKFSARHELQAATWTQRVLNRLGPLKSMNGRETIRASLKKLGFEIR